MVVWNDMDLNEPVRVYHKSVDVQQEAGYSDTFGSFRMQIRSGDVLIPKITANEPLEAECSHFLECILGKAAPINDGLTALRVVRALEAADRSLANRSAVAEILPTTIPVRSHIPAPHFHTHAAKRSNAA
jgi:predicted dehydrogenase